MCAESKVTDANQTQVPAAVRERFGVSPGDVVVWEETPEGDLRVHFRRKFQLKDGLGMFPADPKATGLRDAVRDKKRAQRGEL